MWFEYWVMDLSIFLFCSRRVQFSPSVLFSFWHELNSQRWSRLILIRSLFAVKWKDHSGLWNKPLRETPVTPASHNNRPVPPGADLSTQTPWQACTTVFHLSARSISLRTDYVCVVTRHEKERDTENRERGRKGERKGKRMKKRLYWAKRAALQGSSCCVLIRAGCENKSL